MRVQTNLCYDAKHPESCVLDLYLPDSDAPCPLLIYFHGGGLESGSRGEIGTLPELADRGIALASADYRMYPDARYPDFIEDAAAAVAYAVEEPGKRHPFSKTCIGGSSAGAYLAMMLCFDGEYLSRRGLSARKVDGWFFDAGQPTVHFNVLAKRGADPRLVRVDEAAPLYFAGAAAPDERGPMLFVTAEHDIPGRVEQTALMLRTLKEFGYPENRLNWLQMTGCCHCGYEIRDIAADFILRS